MNPFFISDAAKIEIEKLIKRSGCRDPVISLRDSATLKLPDDLKSAARHGTATHAQFDEIRRRAVQLLEDGSASSIEVAVFERSEYRAQDLCEIGTIAMGMTTPMREALQGYCLTCIDERFALTAADETVFSLRAVKTLAKWFT